MKESLPWRKAYPNFSGGVALRAARIREGLAMEELAAIADINRHHISRMESGKTAISEDMARKLAEILKVDYRVFL
jgi:transcriptional regulator with XRE-family HTH domain